MFEDRELEAPLSGLFIMHQHTHWPKPPMWNLLKGDTKYHTNSTFPGWPTGIPSPWHLPTATRKPLPPSALGEAFPYTLNICLTSKTKHNKTQQGPQLFNWKPLMPFTKWNMPTQHSPRVQAKTTNTDFLTWKKKKKRFLWPPPKTSSNEPPTEQKHLPSC